jgi:hypothetical protein
MPDQRRAFTTKKADVFEPPKDRGHAGLLVNKPLGVTELLFV